MPACPLPDTLARYVPTTGSCAGLLVSNERFEGARETTNERASRGLRESVNEARRQFG